MFAKHSFTIALCAALTASACSRHEAGANEVAVAPATPQLLLTRDAYLGAVDSLLKGMRGKAKRVWIEGPGAVWLTQADLHRLQARRGNGFRNCPGEPTLVLKVPVQRAPHRVEFYMIERAGGNPLPSVFQFACADGRCSLRAHLYTNELMVGTCGPGVEFGLRPRLHPLTGALQ